MSENHTLLPLPPSIRALTTEQSLRLEKTFPNLPPPARCITCRGAKTFLWYAPNTNDVVTYDCPCNDQFLLHRRLLYSGIHENFQRLGWRDVVDLSAEINTSVVEYLSKAPQFVAAGFGLIFYGDKGNGKTLISNLIVKDLIGQGFDCYANTFSTLIDTFADGWKDKADREWFSQRVRNADVLLIDDLGRERNKGVGTLGENALEETIRHRIARSKPTLITTNKSPAEVEQGYGGHTMSLLHERSDTYRFNGPDRRTEMNLRFRSEILSGVTRPIVLA